jgi:type IV pilus assembly protein PilZ
MAAKTIDYIIQNQLELNFSYMPFIVDGGLFIPTIEKYSLGEKIQLNLQLPGQLEIHSIEVKIIWTTPKNTLYQILPGIGVELIGVNAKALRDQIKANVDNKMEVGAYVYGMSTEGETH